jgi:pSer/pThr/pTyr-binding forkhead associated (FHA) protein
MDVKLLMMKTNGEPKEIPLPKPVTVVGRGNDCDLRIPIESCSRKQCELRVEDNKLMMRDLGSSNGTFVNNQRVDQAELKAGDRLTVGPIVLTVQIDGEPANIPAEAQQEQQAAASTQEESSAMDMLGQEQGQEQEQASAPAEAEEEGIPFSDLGEEPSEEGEMSDDPLAALEMLADTEEEEENPPG